jgi:TonB family protein
MTAPWRGKLCDDDIGSNVGARDSLDSAHCKEHDVAHSSITHLARRSALPMTCLLLAACAEVPAQSPADVVSASVKREEFINDDLMGKTLLGRQMAKRRLLDSRCRPPEYSDESLDALEEGTTRVAIDLDDKGAVLGVRLVLSSGFARLDAAAVAAFKLCKFPPALKDDQPVMSTMQIDYIWTLPKWQPPDPGVGQRRSKLSR